MRKEFIERVKLEEGFSSQSYWDDAPGGGGGQWTWGYGTRAPGAGASITKEQAEIELVKELVEAEKDFAMIFQTDPPGITTARREAIVDMLFNLGADRFAGFVYTVRSIKDGNWVSAAAHAQQSLWYRQVGARARRIVEELRTGWDNGIEPVAPLQETHRPVTVESNTKEVARWIVELLGGFWRSGMWP